MKYSKDSQKTNLKLSANCGQLFSPLRMKDGFADSVVPHKISDVLK